jgi:hypothetical protein
VCCHPLDAHRNLHTEFTDTQESISEITSSGNDGSIAGDDATVDSNTRKFLLFLDMTTASF